VDDKDGTGMLNVNIPVTGYRHAGNYRLNRQKQRGEVERRGTSMYVYVCMCVYMCMYVRVCACMYVCIYIYIYITFFKLKANLFYIAWYIKCKNVVLFGTKFFFILCRFVFCHCVNLLLFLSLYVGIEYSVLFYLFIISILHIGYGNVVLFYFIYCLSMYRLL